MIWLAWRQHRTEYLIMSAILAVLAVFLIVTGLDMAHASQQLGLNACLAQAKERSNCASLITLFQNQFILFLRLYGSVNILPPLLGLLVGAPLIARELEQGTHRLVWTQSITRFRWLSVKLALLLSVSLLASGILMALVIWWYRSFAQFSGSFSPTTFDFSGPVWLASTLLALALGIFAGSLARRTVLAMFVMLILFLAIRLPVELFLRPNYQPAITQTRSIDQQNLPFTSPSAQDWVVERGWMDAQGNVTKSGSCTANQTPLQCLKANGVRTIYLTYQPADRFWTFQWIETGIYLTFTILALGAATWLVRQRLN